MSKKSKIWLITAVFLIIIGSIVFALAMFKTGWDFTKLSTVKFETNTYELNDDFNSISISADTADVQIIKSETEKAKVVCFERENFKHAVIVNNGVLEIVVDNQTSLKGYIGINFQNPSITIYLPDNAYSNLNVKSVTSDIEISKDFTFDSISVEVSTGNVNCFATVESDITFKTSTGDIKLENLTVNSLSLSTSTGKITATDIVVVENAEVNVSTGKALIKNLTCKNFLSSGSTGDVYLENVIAVEKIDVKRNTGDVEFDGIDAGEIEIKTSTGDVEGSLLTEKTFSIKTNTGDVDVPRISSGGLCKITTDTGDIDIEIK